MELSPQQKVLILQWLSTNVHSYRANTAAPGPLMTSPGIASLREDEVDSYLHWYREHVTEVILLDRTQVKRDNDNTLIALVVKQLGVEGIVIVPPAAAVRFSGVRLN